MNAMNELTPLLKKLRMSGVLQTLDIRVKQATEDDFSHVEFLIRLLTDEVERREAKQLDRRLRKAGFARQKTLEDFDFRFNPKIPKAQILDLGTCSFIDRKEPVLLVGPAGVGKSHVAQALGHRACRAGYETVYVSANELFKQLRASRADGSYDRKLLRYTEPPLLILDDLGLRPLVGDEPLDLYEIIRQRHERVSTIVTSNRAVEEMGRLFPDPLMASSAMDRLLQEAHMVVMEGDSYRNPPASKRNRKRRAA